MWRWGLRGAVLLVVAWAAVTTVMDERREARRTSRLDVTRGSEPAPAAGDDTGLAGRDHQVGECLAWDQEARSGSVAAVPCEEPHVMEVTARVTLPAEPVGYPDEPAWATTLVDRCRPAAAAYLGRPLDPFGRFSLHALHPRADAWARGDRDYWCGLTAVGSGGATGGVLPLKSGRAADADQSFLWPAGTCLAAQPFGPVPCDRPHRYEVTGAVDLTGRAAEPSPGEWEEIGWRGPCRQRAAEYLGRPPAAGGGVATTVLRLEPASWAAGSRQATCVIGRSDGKGTPVDSTGSVRG